MKTLNKLLLYTIALGSLSSCYKNQTNCELEKQIVSLRKENYNLHLELINNGNPHGWKLNGDELGGWWYEKAYISSDNDTIFKYLEKK